MLKKLRKVKFGSKGFTLVELLVVIAILGILAAIVIPKLSGQTTTARVGQLKADLATMDNAIQIATVQGNGTAPTALASLSPSYLAAVPVGPSGQVVSGTATFISYSLSGGRAAANIGGTYYTVEGITW